MQVLRSVWRRALAGVFAATASVGCAGDLTSAGALSETVVERVAVVVNRADRTLTVIPFGERVAARTIVLGSAGAPVDVAVRGETAVVPMGDAGVAVVNLRTGTVERTLAMEDSRFNARRAAFVSDTLVLVTNPSRATITPLNPVTGRVGASTTVGGPLPVDLLRAGARVYVLNGQSVSLGSPTGVVTVLDTLLRKVDTIRLSGINPAAAVVRGDILYVLQSGHRGQGDGSLAVVDLTSMREKFVVEGFGEFPESMAADARGDLIVPTRQQGLVIFNPSTGVFARGAGSPLPLGGIDDAVRVASDPAGFVYALLSGACERAGTLVRLASDGTPAASALTGICPADVEFTSLAPR